MDRPEECSPQVGEERLASLCTLIELMEHEVARPYAQFFRRKLAVGDDHQPGEDVVLGTVTVKREVGDPARDSRRFANPGTGRDTKILIQGVNESLARFGVDAASGKLVIIRRASLQGMWKPSTLNRVSPSRLATDFPQPLAPARRHR